MSGCARCTEEGCQCGVRAPREEPTYHRWENGFGEEGYLPLDPGAFELALAPHAWQRLIEGGTVWLSLEVGPFAEQPRALRLELESEDAR